MKRVSVRGGIGLSGAERGAGKIEVSDDQLFDRGNVSAIEYMRRVSGIISPMVTITIRLDEIALLASRDNIWT